MILLSPTSTPSLVPYIINMKYIYVRCPEYDTLESNKYTVAGTLHKCNGGDGYWSDCDRGGCQNNAFYVDSSMFCPEDRYPVLLYLNSG